MILLETSNLVVTELLESHIKGGNRASVDITIADFDGVIFYIHSHQENKAIIIMSMSMPGAKECMANGGEKMLTDTYGALLIDKEEGYDVTMQIDCDNIAGEHDAVIANLASLKRNLLGAPLNLAFEAVIGGSQPEIITIPYRGDECMYIVPQKNQVVLVFNVLFKDADDVVFAKVFLQEFQDARRRVQQAPAVTYSKEVPLEIQSLQLRELDNQGFVSFVIFPRHFEGSQREKSVSLLQTFRNYLHYHIKCSKAYMHTRMRARVDLLLKVLNRARPTGEKKEKKTASGRTFVRS